MQKYKKNLYLCTNYNERTYSHNIDFYHNSSFDHNIGPNFYWFYQNETFKRRCL